MTTETVSLDFLAKQAKSNLDETRLVRKDLADMMRLMNASYELTRRIDRRHLELRDDMELMVKVELGGALANIQTTIEASLVRIEDNVGEIARRLTALETSP